MKREIVLASLAFIPLACQSVEGASRSFGELSEVDAVRADYLNERVNAILDSKGIVTAGLGLIKDGKLVWSTYYGVEASGQAASADTRFNVASITKTVTGELMVQLVQAGEISMDEPMSDYWLDPDIIDDPRHADLTPGIAITNRTGFDNWRFFRPDGKLTFNRDPGEAYGYSGEGFDYFARFAERKLGQTFPELVQNYVFDPLGMSNSYVAAGPEAAEHAVAGQTEDGEAPGIFCREQSGWCREPGEWGSAANMMTTVPDYARFLTGMLDQGRYDQSIQQQRYKVQADTGEDGVVDCESDMQTPCPERQGYGYGTIILQYPRTTVVGHGGYDWSQLAVAYGYTGSDDGVIIFLNAPVRLALRVMPDLIELLDPHSPFIGQYQRWDVRENGPTGYEMSD
ncbi:serine hydrolase domain-containing protein [Henriciella litoralis]|uniref:serine hydrolase domain-containing protein n=1 Tax=Henriciella litoralis TaxID=568102 RepID=UPI000A00E791|nr:serine hydrolase domain-containing protein [Henriciella litoralis]